MGFVSYQAITTPAMAVSHIMLEAYKKYILVSLILHGKVQQLPKYTSQIVGRFIKVGMYTRWDFHSFLPELSFWDCTQARSLNVFFFYLSQL